MESNEAPENHRRFTPPQRACAAVEALPSIAEEIRHGGGGLEAAALAARRFAVNRQYVYSAKRIRNNDEALFEEVKNGAVSLREAIRRLDAVPKTKRTASPRKPRSRRTARSRDITPEPAPGRTEITALNDGYYLFVSSDWRSEIPRAMADERLFVKAMRNGLTIHLKEASSE